MFLANASIAKDCIQISALKSWVQNGILNITELERFHDGLKSGRIPDLLLSGDQTPRLDRSIFQDVFRILFTHSKPKAHELESQVKALLELKRRELVKKKSQYLQNANLIDLRFHAIEPGSIDLKIDVTFYSRKLRRKIIKSNAHPIHLGHSFELSQYWISVQDWLNVMGAVPEKLSKARLDEPIREITWWSMLFYLNKLSILKGYPPSYLLDEIPWRGTDPSLDAALGILKPKRLVFYSEIINALDANPYLTEGYRLPTIFEAVSVLDAFIQSEQNPKSNLEDYFWMNHFTKPMFRLGQKSPAIIQNGIYYDLLASTVLWTTHDCRISQSRQHQKFEIGYKEILEDLPISAAFSPSTTKIQEVYAIPLCPPSSGTANPLLPGLFNQIDSADPSYHGNVMGLRPVRTIFK